MIRAAEHVERFPCTDTCSKRKLERVGAMLRRKADELRHGQAKDPVRTMSEGGDALSAIEQEVWFNAKAIALLILIGAAAFFLWRVFGGAA